jgi:hypothetical protein
MWTIEIQMKGDEPTEAEVEAAEAQIEAALDEAGVDYADIRAV